MLCDVCEEHTVDVRGVEISARATVGSCGTSMVLCVMMCLRCWAIVYGREDSATAVLNSVVDAYTNECMEMVERHEEREARAMPEHTARLKEILADRRPREGSA